MEKSGSEFDLPGFRFHPTEEELLDFYLRQMVQRKKLNFDIIGTINLYRYDPWELPGLAKIGEREWYFFVPRDRRQSSGGRPNRTTERGFWKATGSDRPIRSATDPKRLIGLKKTLVFYMGRAPRGSKTDWIMNEYRLPGFSSTIPPPQEDIVLCKVYRKATPLKELEQRAAMEEEARSSLAGTSMSIEDTVSQSELDPNFHASSNLNIEDAINYELQSKDDDQTKQESEMPSSSNAQSVVNLPALEALSIYEMDWMQDPFSPQLRSPWMEPLSPLRSNLLHFLNAP